MKNLPNSAKEQKAAIVNFLGQSLANSFNAEIIEYKKSHLLFIFNKKQIAISVSVSDPPFTIPEVNQPVFLPKPYYQDLTKFDIDARESKNQEKENELIQREKEVKDMMDKMLSLQKELDTKEKMIKSQKSESDKKELEFNELKKEIARQKLELDNQNKEIESQRIELDNQSKEIYNQKLKLEDKNKELQTQYKELEEQHLQLNIIENSKLEDRETRINNRIMELDKKEIELNVSKKQLQEKEELLSNAEKRLEMEKMKLNNHVNDAMLRQNDLDNKEKELAKIKEILDTARQNLEEREKEIEIKEQQLNNIDLSDARTPLKSPILSIEEINGISYLKWNAIEGADNYSINYLFNSQPVDTSKIDFDVSIVNDSILVNLSSFVKSGEYIFSITAVADENNESKSSLPSAPITHFIFNEFEN